MVTMDMHFGRVRVFVNSEGKGLAQRYFSFII